MFFPNSWKEEYEENEEEEEEDNEEEEEQRRSNHFTPEQPELKQSKFWLLWCDMVCSPE